MIGYDGEVHAALDDPGAEILVAWHDFEEAATTGANEEWYLVSQGGRCDYKCYETYTIVNKNSAKGAIPSVSAQTFVGINQLEASQH